VSFRADLPRVEHEASAGVAGKIFASTHWVLLFLLFLSATINYVDRGSISVAAPVLAQDLSIFPLQMGLLFSGFFWSYTGVMVAAGWICDRYNIYWVLGAGYFLWSMATLSSGFVKTFSALFALRLVLGVGEAVAFPSYSRIIAWSFPIDRRGLPNSLLDAGTKVGAAAGTLLGGLIVARFGWRWLLVGLGLISLTWLIPWCIWAPQNLRVREDLQRKGPSLLLILRKRDAWGTFLGNFCANYSYYFLLTWLPFYLVRVRHLSLSRMAVLGSLPFMTSALTSVLGGWGADRWIRHGTSPTRARKTFVVSGILLSTLMLPSALVSNVNACIALLIAAYFAFGLFSSNHWAITQTLAGPWAAGRWTGLQNCLSNIAGIAAPYLTGWIVVKTGSFFLAFLSASVMMLVGAASYLFLVGEVHPIAWDEEEIDQSTPSP
jgi:ACS family D-galactonate transporter-like MFS transporter